MWLYLLFDNNNRNSPFHSKNSLKCVLVKQIVSGNKNIWNWLKLLNLSFILLMKVLFNLNSLMRL